MHNELTIEQFGYSKKKSNKNKTVSKLKNIGNDSLFYFAIFLSAFFFLQFTPYVAGMFGDFNIGFNEVIVSFIGFANVFFLQVYNKLFKNNKFL